MTDWAEHLDRVRQEKARRDAIPERPAHLPWLHGEVKPAVSPREARELANARRVERSPLST